MPLVILGAGGHGRVVGETAKICGLSPSGFADDNPTLATSRPLGLPIFGPIDMVINRTAVCNAVLLGIGNHEIRLSLIARAQHAGLETPTVIHPRAWVSPTASIGAGSVVMANATIQAGSRLGIGIIVNTNASVDHDCVLDDGVHIAPGAHLAGNVMVGHGTHIGIGASVIEGIRIGANCLIAAGAVVVRDVPDGERVAGVPARPMRRQEQG